MFNFGLVFEALLLLSVLATWMSQSLLDFSVLAVLVLIIIRQKSQFNRNVIQVFKNTKWVMFCFVAYFVVACLGYVFNARPGAEAFTNLKKFDWILQFVLIYMAITFLTGRFQSMLIEKMKYVLLLPALFGFSIYLNNGYDIITNRFASGRVLGLINSSTYHAYVGVLIFTAFLVLVLETKKATKNNVFILAAIFLSLIFTQTRGALIAFVLGFAIYLFLTKKHLLTKKTIAIGLVVCLALTALAKEYIWQYRADSNQCRQDLINIHIGIVKQYPLLGIGYRDNMRNLIDFWPKDQTSVCMETIKEGSQAHNQFLNVAATTGLLGLVFFLAFYSYFVVIAFKLTQRKDIDPKDQPMIWVLFTVIIVFTFSSLFEVMFEFGKIRYLLIFTWAFVHFYWDKYKKQIKTIVL